MAGRTQPTDRAEERTLYRHEQALRLLARLREQATAHAPADVGAVLSELERLVTGLGDHLRSESLVASIATRILDVPTAEVEEGMVDALEALGRAAGVQRAYVFLLSEDGERLDEFYEWAAEGVQRHDFAAFHGLSVDGLPWSMAEWRRGNPIVVADSDALPPEAEAERAACAALEIKSYVNMPILVADQLAGWLGYDSVDRPHAWSAEELHLMSVACQVLASSVGRRRTDIERFSRRELADRMIALGRLSAGVAHEINNPLSYVAGNLDLATEMLQPERGNIGTSEWVRDLREIIDDASEGAHRIARILVDLRALAEPGPIDPEPTELEEVVRRACRLAASHLESRAVLVCEIEPLPPVWGTSSGLGQVVLNLVVNAAQAIEPGDPDRHRVRLSARAAGDEVVLEVSDTGAGIAAEVLPHVFDPFYTTRGPRGGTGLGLSICHRIVSAFGGRISAQGRAGAGSTFRVVLRRAEREQGPDPAPAVEHPAGRALRVLAIDDDPQVLRLVARVLARHEVTPATDAEQALARLEATTAYDVILLDVRMPGTDGRELFARLRDRWPRLAPRVVFITADTLSSETARFLASVPNRSLVKPFEASALRELVTEIAERRTS